MIGSRRDETEDEILEEEEEIAPSGEEKKPLSLSERRALRKAKRSGKLAQPDDEESDSSRTARKQTPTRSQEEALKQRERQSLNRLETIPLAGRLFTYLRNVSAEMKKVSWPTREEARRLTLIVVSVTVAFSVVLGLIDVFYGWWFREAVNDTAIFLLVAVPFFLIGGGLFWYYILREEA